MATKIRLKRFGKIRTPHYRVVVMDSRTKRDGRAIEEIGQYHPKSDPSEITVDSERVQYWLGVGAQPTEAVIALLKRTGDWQKFTGDTTAAGIDPQPTRQDKDELFAAALAEEDDAPREAITKKADETKDDEAKADEAAAKTAWQGKVDGYRLCQVQDRVAAKYRESAGAAGKTLAPAVTTPPCTDPGPFVYTPTEVKPLEQAGALGSLAASEVIAHWGPRPMTPLKDLAAQHGLTVG